MRGFDSVPAVPGGLELTRVARQGPIHQDAMVQRLVDFGELVFPPTTLFEVSEMGTRQLPVTFAVSIAICFPKGSADAS